MKFRYKKTFSQVVTPIIPVQLSYGEEIFKTSALIDSGSPWNIFDREIAEVFSIKIKEGRKNKITGVTGGTEDLYMHNAKIAVKDYSYETEIGFMNNRKFEYNILGQNGFFSAFKVFLNLREGLINIEPFKNIN